MELLNDVIKFFIASGIIAFLIRSIITIILKRDIEKYKLDLNKQLELYKTLTTERTIVIKEVYKKIDRTFRSLESLIRPLQLEGELVEPEKRKIFVKEYNSFVSYFKENKIFFTETSSFDIELFIKDVDEVWRSWNLYLDLKKNGESSVNEWGRSWDKLQKETSLLKEKLEQIFRQLIGVV
ncbi:MAG: hypothetical protein RBS13_04730 [Bacteroidales bacterium]|jgi:hypothetical protein|nr:hypothetical protein [Bacteroidales bacterium]